MGKAKLNHIKPKKIALEKQIVDGKILRKNKNKQNVNFRSEDDSILDSKTSKKILLVAKQQQLELNTDNFPSLSVRKNDKINLGVVGNYDHNLEICENDFVDDITLDDEDKEAFQRFQNADKEKKTLNLSQVILKKIAAKQGDIQSKFSDEGTLKLENIDSRVREMYEGVRDVMKRYRSGKVPKAFKIIPKLRNWEQILFLTEPHNWSAAAIFQGTRIFCSILSQAMAQRFYNLVLLPRIRDDLAEFKKLNMHLYNALKLALFKPAAFMKGIILPLLESGDCTLREAIIFASVVARNSVPLLHASACLLKICEMEYTGANSIFIRVFLDKRYALPYRVVDAAIFHFLRFANDKRTMPLLWHQSLLSFVQRYKNDISHEQKEALLDLLRKQAHPKITPDVRRELQSAICRDFEIIKSGNSSQCPESYEN